jgi:hypothetical protein
MGNNYVGSKRGRDLRPADIYFTRTQVIQLQRFDLAADVSVRLIDSISLKPLLHAALLRQCLFCAAPPTYLQSTIGVIFRCSQKNHSMMR